MLRYACDVLTFEPVAAYKSRACERPPTQLFDHHRWLLPLATISVPRQDCAPLRSDATSFVGGESKRVKTSCRLLHFSHEGDSLWTVCTNYNDTMDTHASTLHAYHHSGTHEASQDDKRGHVLCFGSRKVLVVVIRGL